VPPVSSVLFLYLHLNTSSRRAGSLAIMSWLTTFVLYVAHALYSLISSVSFLRQRWRLRLPLSLNAARRQVPGHIALLLVPDERESSEQLEKSLTDIALRVSEWCRVVGVSRLTMYDRGGLLANLTLDIKERVSNPLDDCSDDSSAESEIEYPLTPPLTDESRSISPDLEVLPDLNTSTITLSAFPKIRTRSTTRGVVKRRNRHKKETQTQAHPLTLHLTSRASGKQAIADLATCFLERHVSNRSGNKFTCSTEDINFALEGDHGFSSPELMIVHDMSRSTALELYGFPPWQIRLTEIYHVHHRSSWSWSSPPTLSESFSEIDFRRALDEYAAAEMRLGK